MILPGMKVFGFCPSVTLPQVPHRVPPVLPETNAFDGFGRPGLNQGINGEPVVACDG